MPALSLVMRMALISLTLSTTLLIMLLMQSMGAILTSKASLTLIFGLCEGVSLLRKITITVDDVTLDGLRAFREVFGIPHSAVIRRAVWAYYQDKFSIPSYNKK